MLVYQCVCVCVCLCLCAVCVHAPLWCCCFLSKKLYPAVYKWVLGVNWGSKCQLCVSRIVGEDPGGTSGVHILTCETWDSLLRVTSPVSGAFTSAESQHLGSIQVPSACHWVGMTTQRSHAKALKLCVCMCICVCVCACVCVHVCAQECVHVCMCVCVHTSVQSVTYTIAKTIIIAIQHKDKFHYAGENDGITSQNLLLPVQYYKSLRRIAKYSINICITSYMHAQDIAFTIS